MLLSVIKMVFYTYFTPDGYFQIVLGRSCLHFDQLPNSKDTVDTTSEFSKLLKMLKSTSLFLKHVRRFEKLKFVGQLKYQKNSIRYWSGISDPSKIKIQTISDHNSPISLKPLTESTGQSEDKTGPNDADRPSILKQFIFCYIAQWPERGRYAALDETMIFKPEISKSFIYISKYFKMNRISIRNLYFTILFEK